MDTNDIIKLSNHIVIEYYSNNLKPFFDHLDNDVIWFGPADKQILRSKQAIISAWSKEKSDLTFTMGNIQEYPVPLTSKCCNIIITFPIYTHYPDGTSHLHNQRIDFTWIERRILENNAYVTVPRLIKIHISNAFRLSDEDFIYPVHSKANNTGQIVSSISNGSYILFKGKDGQIYNYLSDSILWIEKHNEGRNAVIHTMTDAVLCVEKTDMFLQKYPDVFLTPHTSYLINPIHIASIKRFSVTLDNEKQLPISEKKYTRFKADFAEWIRQHN